MIRENHCKVTSGGQARPVRELDAHRREYLGLDEIYSRVADRVVEYNGIDIDEISCLVRGLTDLSPREGRHELLNT